MSEVLYGVQYGPIMLLLCVRSSPTAGVAALPSVAVAVVITPKSLLFIRLLRI